MPRKHDVARLRAPELCCPLMIRLFRASIALVALIVPCIAAAPSTTLAAPRSDAPPLSLPTPEGEPWKIIQGYGCGTHNAWDRYSIDLANAHGRTYGAPVRAAADGDVFVWVPKSGTIILSHGGGLYTMYTHMSSAVSTAVGRHFARGEVLGAVGDRGAPGTPHLHFTAFTAEGPWAAHRTSIPLSFAEGFRLADVGGCSQHQGEQLTATGPLADADGLAFRSNGEPNRWYNQDLAIEFGGTAAAHGYSVAWEDDPGGDAPRVLDTRSGQAKLSEAGEGLHKLYVRAWDAQGNQTTAVYGPIGLDVTPPEARPMAQPATVAAGQPSAIEWPAALDNGSGVAGYRVYVGGEPGGTSEWYVTTPHADLPALEPGDYIVRVQPIDYAGNSADWATIGALTAR